jgi:hypothetical protein
MKIVNIENFLLLIGTLVITASVALVTKKQPRRGNNKSYLEILFVSGLSLSAVLAMSKVVYKVLTDENFQNCLGSDSQILLLLAALLGIYISIKEIWKLWLFVTLYAKSTDKMPRQHTSNPKIPKVSKAIGSPFY